MQRHGVGWLLCASEGGGVQVRVGAKECVTLQVLALARSSRSVRARTAIRAANNNLWGFAECTGAGPGTAELEGSSITAASIAG